MKVTAINFFHFIIISFFGLVFTLNLNAQITTFPYVEDFESGPNGWTVDGNLPSWELGTPDKNQTINMAASGSKAWVTNLDGNYNNLDQSWVESPSFDLSALTNPVIELNIWWSLETVWDGAYIESSIDNGSSWQIIGSVGTGLNWYNNSDIYPGINTDAWSNNSNGWKTAANYITNLAGQSNVKFRIYLLSNNNTTREGVAFDDFKIYDRPSNISIPDSEFEQYLVDSGKDTDGVVNGQIAEEDCFTMSTLSPFNSNIQSFEGLQYFTGLSGFYMSNNAAGSINAIDFSSNPNLLEIFISSSPNISGITFGINPRLDTISITSGNNSNFSTIDLTSLSNLGYLELLYLGLTNLNLEENKNLYSVNLSNNPLSSLNFPILPSLNNLDVSNTSLSTLDVSWFENLATLNTSFTNIVNLDLSYNPNMNTLTATDGLLEAVNLQISFEGRNAQGGGYEITNVDLQNNPNLTCILVNDVISAENNSNWFKDVTASFIDSQNVQLLTSAANGDISYEEDIDLSEFRDWINNNGGATASTSCIDLLWNYQITETYFDNDFDGFNNDLLLSVNFGYNDGSGFVSLSSADFTYWDLPIIGFGNGSFGALCDIETYDLQDLMDYDLSGPSYVASNITIEQDPTSDGFGDSGGGVDGTVVDFPDKGAGSYTFIYNATVSTSISVGDFSTTLESSDLFFVNEVNITFNAGNDKVVPICIGETLTLQELTDALDITPELTPQPGLDPNDYWFDAGNNNLNSDVGAGVYTFDASGFFTDCPVTTATITLVEYNTISAGIDVTESDPSVYKCGETILFDLNSYLDVSADPYGKWYDSDNNEIPDGVYSFVSAVGNLSKIFRYEHESRSCWTLDDANYEISFTVIDRSAGENGTLEILQGETVTEQQLFDALQGSPDLGGTWSPELAGAGVYTYTLASTAECLEQTATVTVGEETLSISDNELEHIILYPNPTKDKVFIKNHKSDIETIELYDITGKLIKRFSGNNESFNTLNLNIGLYFVNIKTLNSTKTFKLIKN
jgi:hypothetical protein